MEVGGLRVLAFLGRLHLYEGYSPVEVVHPVRTAVAAGWWAASGGKRSGFVGAAAFLAALAGGMAAGAAGFVLIGQEAALAGTVVVAGLLLALGVRAKPHAAGVALASFAFVHGCAHGAESAGVAALAGIVGGTATLLALAAVAVGLSTRPALTLAPRFAGLGVAGCGAALLLR